MFALITKSAIFFTVMNPSLLLFAAWAGITTCLAQTYCDRLAPQVPPCADPIPRDLLFVVDGSQSMNRDRFFSEMLEYCLRLYCAFDASEANQAGMIVFNKEIEVLIPLDVYTRNQWEAKVLEIRNTKDDPPEQTACCSCCTPTAEAFTVALQEFNRNAKNAATIAFMITDGVPSNNVVGTGGNPEWHFLNADDGFNPAVYNTHIVPQEAQKLKDAGHRIVLVGVPNFENEPPDQQFFNGGYGDGFSYCLRRDMDEFCTSYNIPPFPIVSLPVSDNSHSSPTWNVDNLIENTVEKLCIPPSAAPTTASPSKNPTRKPSRLPTLSPTSVDLDQLDLTLLIDRSKSMLWREDHCDEVLQGLSPVGNRSPSSSCWEVLLKYTLDQVDAIAALDGVGKHNNRILGWHDDHLGSARPAKGLRVNLVGFYCENNQIRPRVQHFSEDYANGTITNRETLLMVLKRMRDEVHPYGGTCPGASIEESVLLVEKASEEDFPLQAVGIVTDGVFYDQPHPFRATRGLEVYGVTRFAVGIAYANKGETYGLTPEEIRVQRTQLRAFVGGNEDLFFDLGDDGWRSILNGVAQDVVSKVVPARFIAKETIPRGTWCGWRRRVLCYANGWHSGYCRWKGTSRAAYKCTRRPTRRPSRKALQPRNRRNRRRRRGLLEKL